MQAAGSMARSGRKRSNMAAREPNGRIKRDPDDREIAPSDVRRLRDAALRGLRDAEWGTERGRLYLEGALTGAMYAAGKRWRQHAADYRCAIGAFPVRSASLERGSHGTAPDPDSEDGRKQAVRDANATERFFAAHAALVLAGMGAETAVRRLCEDDASLIGLGELKNARIGLSALAGHYNLTAAQKPGMSETQS
jgi:hypothetical protein